MMGSAGITNVGPINTPTTGKGAIAGFDPIMNASKRRTKTVSYTHLTLPTKA